MTSTSIPNAFGGQVLGDDDPDGWANAARVWTVRTFLSEGMQLGAPVAPEEACTWLKRKERSAVLSDRALISLLVRLPDGKGLRTSTAA